MNRLKKDEIGLQGESGVLESKDVVSNSIFNSYCSPTQSYSRKGV